MNVLELFEPDVGIDVMSGFLSYVAWFPCLCRRPQLGLGRQAVDGPSVPKSASIWD